MRQEHGPGTHSVWGWQGVGEGGIFGGESHCFVETELGTRVIGAGEAGRGLRRGHRGKPVGLASIYSFAYIPLHHEEQPSPTPSPGLSASPGNGCTETRGVSKASV